jgi:hypothetical protein
MPGAGDFFGEGCLAGQPSAHSLGHRHVKLDHRKD